jgi:hypothetical protein
VGVSEVGLRLSRYVICWNVRLFSWLSILRINVVGDKCIDANGRNGGIGHSKTLLHNVSAQRAAKPSAGAKGYAISAARACRDIFEVVVVPAIVPFLLKFKSVTN